MAKGRISQRTIAQLKAGQVLWDDIVRGFGVRRQRSTAVYVLKYRFRRRQRFVTIGPHGSPWDVDDARQEARRLLGILASKERPRDPAEERDRAASETDFAAFSKRYLAEFAAIRKKPRSIAEDTRNLEAHILPTIGKLKLSEISRSDLIQFHLSMKSTPIAANRCLALVSHIFSMAEKWGLSEFGANPCKRIDRYKEKRRERFLSEEEISRLGDALRAAETNYTIHQSTRRSPEDWRAIVCYRLLLYTGARLGEILSLQWDWIDWDRGVARLPDSKTGARDLILSQQAMTVLRSIKKRNFQLYPGNKFVLPGDKQGKPFSGIQKPWQRIRQLANLPDVRLHDLRHSFASTAVSSGHSLYIVGTLLGHQNVSTTQRYAHLSTAPIKEVSDRIATKIASLIEQDSSF